jgi:hypothetical protein
MTRPTLLLLTDLSNGDAEEDILLSTAIREQFQVIIAHPADCGTIEDCVDEIIIRNTWNERDFGKPLLRFRERFRKKHLNVHDDLYEHGGDSKDYLLDLYEQGCPVIPTVADIDSLDSLPSTTTYFIKPKDGFDAIGARKIPKVDLLKLNPTNCLIQPHIDFEFEISFYYLDKKLQYVMYAPDKAKRWDLVPFIPSDSDIHFAAQFLRRNKQKYGIERIDVCKQKDGGLLLMEITDQGGVYLSLPDLTDDTRQRFLDNLVESLLRRIILGDRHSMTKARQSTQECKIIDG